MRERDDELSPSLRAFIVLTRFWLNLGFVLTFLGAMGLGIVVSVLLYRKFPGGNLFVPIVGGPIAIAAFVVLAKARRLAARALTRRIEKKLGAISGASSTAALPAGFEGSPKRPP